MSSETDSSSPEVSEDSEVGPIGIYLRKKTDIFSRYREWARLHFPISMFIVFYVISTTYFLTIALIRDLSTSPCNFLACYYPAQATIGVEVSIAIVALPQFVSFLLHLTNQSFILAAFLFVLPYEFGLSYLTARIYYKVRKRPIPEFLDTPLQRAALFEAVAMYFIISTFLVLTLMTYLYYPRIQIQIGYMDFVTVATLLVALMVFYFTRGLPFSVKYYARKGIVRIGLATLLILIYGAFWSFTSSIHVISTPDTLSDLASIEAFQVGAMGGGLAGLFVMFYFMVEHISAHNR